ncbi:MAG: IS91 family transposase, partial [Rhodobacteraceae bacterium]|nr:IS91 family transposase [Paracoccaceae bacterium]
MMVLHTWNQKLEAHGHVHAVVPGAGPSLDGDRWVRTPPRYLVDADALRAAYRRAFLDGLERLWRRGELKLEGEFACHRDPDRWAERMERLRETNWVSYIEPPVGERSDPRTVVKYLARYLTGGPISDARIVSADEHQVTFLAREGKTPGGEDARIPVSVPLAEFVRRWSLHVLPRGYTKTRYFGGYGNRLR